MRSDPRFAQHLAAHEEIDEDDDEEDGDNSDVESESRESADSASQSEEHADDIPEEELNALDEDAANWSGSEVEFCEATRRLAIVNCDWDHVRATDLYAILFHTLPLGGQLHDVKIYLSDFGKKMIEHERVHGPDLWLKPGEEEPVAEAEEPVMEELPSDEPIDEDSSNNDEVDDGWTEDNPTMINQEGEDGEVFSAGKYRKYERDRMKYYYAVATFDTADTAAAVYHELDGLDIEASGVTLDLRYIDDSETFDAKPSQECRKLPPNFKPLGHFKAAALTQSKFRISWDQDDVHRHISIRDSFTGTTEEDDLGAYIAADSSDDAEDDDPTSELRRRKREAERRSIRKKFSELLADIGGIPDEMPSEVDGDSGDESNDDDLNRLSDVEAMSSDDEVMGDMEATIDFDSGTKAQKLQQELLKERQLKDANLGGQAELKYKMKRKANKAAKREMIEELQAAKRSEIEKNRAAQRQTLRDSLGDALESDRNKKSGKEKRKEHAKLKKEQTAKDREEKKKSRLAGALGVSTEVVARSGQKAPPEEPAIDSRFAGRLLADPRFHIDVAQKDKKANPEVVKLASTVIKARQQRDRTTTSASAPASRPGDDAVDYFLSRPAKKSRKEP